MNLARACSLGIALAGCFHPDPPAGIPCGSNTECPDGLRCSVAGLCGGVTPGDASPDGAGDCWASWISGSPTFGPPQHIEAVATSANEGNPSLSEDGLTLYFERGGISGRDIFLTQRDSRDTQWKSPTKVPEFSTADDESKVAVAAGDKIAVISLAIGFSMDLDLFQLERPAAGQPFANRSSAHFAQVNASPSADVDPELTPDGLHLYYASMGGTAVMFTSRTSIDSDFAAPTPVPGIPPGSADPAISPDERVVIYTVDGGTQGRDLMFATRADPGDSFGPPIQLSIDSDKDDADAEVSADGCELLYSSARAGTVGSRDLFSVTVQ